MEKPQKRIEVYENTWILIDADRNPQEARYIWLKKHGLTKTFSDIRKERKMVRTKFKH